MKNEVHPIQNNSINFKQKSACL